jgi:DNA-binding CsgD family transcriptional regulator
MHVVGREPELAALHAFLADPGTRALVLTGGAGIGKTTLWEAGIAAARERGLRVLSARPSDAEAQLAFTALIDLLHGVDLGELGDLAAPQRRALEVALLRLEPGSLPPESRAIAVGLLNALRELGTRAPLVIALDDLPWLDGPSADALTFAARRLEEAPVAFLLARRPGEPSPLERAMEPRGLRRLEVGSLSFGASQHLVMERLGLGLSRRTMRRIFDSAQGNPLFILELGRAMAERGAPAAGADMPLPEAVDDLLGTRVAKLPGPVRRLVLVVSLSADLHASQLAAISGQAAIDEAVDAGLVFLDGDRVRPSHPLLAAAAKQRSRPAERRMLHAELAEVVADEELRALHLALATERPDAKLAGTVAAAAASASARGARREAVQLADHALRLTPARSGERTDRLLSLAAYLDMAGDPERVSALLVPELESLPPGSARLKACLLLNRVVANSDEIESYLERALAESRGDATLRSAVLAEMSIVATTAHVERIQEAEAWALEARVGAALAGHDAERTALDALAWARALRGRPVDDVCERFRALSDAAVYIAASPERVAGQRLAWRGEIQRARAAHERLRSLAEEHGEDVSFSLQGLHLCELELRAGMWETAEQFLEEVVALEEALVSSSSQPLKFPIYERCRALLAAGRGLAEEAERSASEALAHAEASGGRWDLLESKRARGIAALLAHEPSTAVESMRVVWEHTQREGVGEPGVFPVAPDLVEALAELGELDDALAVTGRLGDLAEQQKHPWGLASSKRCGALVQLTQGHDENAAEALGEAAGSYERLGLRFDAARSLLILGRARRRHRKWAAARVSLEQAAAAFDELGSPGWAEEARSELSRIGARRPRPAGELTPSERRVAELAAEGLANKEIARALFVSVKTVETHLSHVYEKLGVRSRTQLARRLS